MIRIARPKARTLALVALPVAAVAITVPTMAVALDSPNTTVYKGCLFEGEISRVTDGAAPTCTGMGGGIFPGDGVGTAITWNQQGVPGTNGTNGTNGKDAYEVAKANGYTGTALQWLTSLRGLPGAKGAAGANGKNGVSGYKMITAETKAKARTAATYTVKCKDGRMALGGGMNGTSDLILNGSGPTADAKGWIVRVTNVAQKSRAVQVYVTCAFAG